MRRKCSVMKRLALVEANSTPEDGRKLKSEKSPREPFLQRVTDQQRPRTTSTMKPSWMPRITSVTSRNGESGMRAAMKEKG